jgi:flavin-dependent dehydrogenase
MTAQWPADDILDKADWYAIEAMKRREYDRQNAERTNAELQAGAEALDDEYEGGSEVETVVKGEQDHRLGWGDRT